MTRPWWTHKNIVKKHNHWWGWQWHPYYFRNRSLRNDILSTVGVVIIWCVLTVVALWSRVLH